MSKPLNITIRVPLSAIYLSAFTGLSFGHGDGDIEWRICPLKDRIHHLCVGHGVIHLAEDELDLLFTRFAEHHEQILSLVDKANGDNYLVQLTHFIERSNFSNNQKKSAYRDIYSKVNIELENGDEWNRTLRKLVSIPGLLDKKELRNHLGSKDQALVSRIQKKLSQPRREGALLNPKLREKIESKTTLPSNDPQAERGEPFGNKKKSTFPWIIAGVLVLGILLLLLKIFKGKSTS